MGRQMVDSLQEYVCFAGSLSVGLFVMIRTKHRRQESIMVRVWAGQPWDLLLLFLCYCEVSAVCYPPISSQVVLMDPDGLSTGAVNDPSRSFTLPREGPQSFLKAPTSATIKPLAL